MIRSYRVFIALVLAACAVEGGGPAEPSARFEALEARLLAADTVRLDFQVSAEGAVEAEVAGSLSITPTGVELVASGRFQDQPVDLFLREDGSGYAFGNAATTRDTLPEPSELREALLVGLTRMGILHNLARLTGAAPPDHADGGVREWVTVDSMAAEPADPQTVSFRVTVDGTPSGSASLEIDDLGLPVLRRQVVHFPSGDMRVEERYSGVTIHP